MFNSKSQDAVMRVCLILPYLQASSAKGKKKKKKKVKKESFDLDIDVREKERLQELKEVIFLDFSIYSVLPSFPNQYIVVTF